MSLGGLLIFPAAQSDVSFKKKSLIYRRVTRKTNHIERDLHLRQLLCKYISLNESKCFVHCKNKINIARRIDTLSGWKGVLFCLPKKGSLEIKTCISSGNFEFNWLFHGFTIAVAIIQSTQ